MGPYYLAIDIGASSGRHILAQKVKGKLVLEEIYRFSNGVIEKNGHLCWDLQRLFEEIKTGMKKCAQLNKIPVSVGIDTWAVDFVLLDEQDCVIGDTVAYRDSRTKGMDQKVYECISEEELYARTGIQKQIFNSIYQLMAIKTNAPEQLQKAKALLMIPDYFHFLLSGVKATEYTNATTMQLVNPTTKDWDRNLIMKLGYPLEIFQNIRKAGTKIGNLTKEMEDEIGYSCQVVLPPTHDTASAVLAVPTTKKNVLYISSGTWSLMGTELRKANCTEQSRQLNFTNEGGYDYRFRFLKNIMGLWMIQSVKKEIAEDLGFEEICTKASMEDIASIVDCNEERFLAPKSMVREVQRACEETGQQVPEGIAQIAAVIYNSLAKCYAKTLKEIEMVTEEKYDCIYVIGGGANARYLNQLTKKETGKTVYAGPSEATATGNIIAQMMTDGVLTNVEDARECIFNSFEINEY